MVQVGDASGHQEPARVLARRRAAQRRLSRSFLILHGLEGSGPDHWQTWLARELRDRGERVSYPDLPDPFDPKPDEWRAALQPELAALEGERIVLCHSLGCLLWLLNARDGATDVADRVLLVAPPKTSEVEPVVRFQPDGVTAADLARAAGQTLMLWSEPDSYCPQTAPVAFPGIFENTKHIPDSGHLNSDAGYGPWPDVEAWALGD